VVTIRRMSKSAFLHVRAEPHEHRLWRVVAASRGQTLSELVRALLTAAAEERVTPQDEGVGSSVSPQTEPARVKAPASLEERLAAIGARLETLGGMSETTSRIAATSVASVLVAPASGGSDPSRVS
jgi:hypothetical protein